MTKSDTSPHQKLLVFPSSPSTAPFPLTPHLLSNNPHLTIYQLSDASPSQQHPENRIKFISQTHLASMMPSIDAILINITYVSPSNEESFRLIRYILKLIEHSYGAQPNGKESGLANATTQWRGRLVLLSNCLTWANSLDIGPEGFSDIESICRIPHPSYQTHYQIEKIVAKMNDLGVHVNVVFSGMWYGRGEVPLHGAMKMSREGKDVLKLPLYTTETCCQGENVIPTIHVDDLSKILSRILESDPSETEEEEASGTPQTAETSNETLLSPATDGIPPPLYIFAVDEVLHTQRDIISSIAQSYGHDTTEFSIVPENASKALLFEYHSHLTLNLKAELNEWVHHHVHGGWHTLSTGFVDNSQRIREEYEEERNLTALRVVVHGPPLCGKSLCSESLSKFYQLPHLHIKGVLDEFFGQETKISARLAEKEIDAQQWMADYKQQQSKKKGKGGDEPLDDDAQIAALKQQLLDLDALKQDVEVDTSNAKKPAKGKGKNAPPEEEEEDRGPRYTDRVLIMAFRWKLNQLECKNHGWIMDGFPKTPSQAIELFSLPDEDPDPASDSKGKKAPKKGAPVVSEPKKSRLADPQLIPHFTFTLSVPTDEFLLSNLNEIPAEIREEHKTHLSDKALLRRLQEYNKQNAAHRVTITPREDVDTQAQAPPADSETTDDVFDTISELRTTMSPESKDQEETEAEVKTESNENEDKTEEEQEDTSSVNERKSSEVQSLTIPIQFIAQDDESITTTEALSVQGVCEKMYDTIGEPHTYEKTVASIQAAVEEVLKETPTVLLEALNDDSAPNAGEVPSISRPASANSLAAGSQHGGSSTLPLEQNPDYIEEQRILDEKAAPLKEKLVDIVLPSLTKALIDCCLYRPEDPLSFLSDKLLEASSELEG
mmetsp:Transcript_4935/g.18582  ORF Transcript_4935/g.18582 Transcript_4935/m.18582 type:complete len:891 (-) Transcript_4935:39-2711(-)